MHKILFNIVTVEIHKIDFVKILWVHVQISEVKRVNKAHGKKRGLFELMER